MPDFQWVKETKTIDALLGGSQRQREEVTQNVNKLLQEGWRLLSINTENSYTDGGTPEMFQVSDTFYILGR